MKHLALQTTLILAMAAPLVAQNTLEIIAAYYGAADRFADVSERTRALARPDGSLQFRVSAATLGAAGTAQAPARVLRIYYKWNGIFQHKEWPDGENVQIGLPTATPQSAETTTGLRISKAIYGAGRRTIDVTTLLQGKVAEGRLELQITNATMGGTDPAPAVVKSLTVSYELDGRTQETLVPENGWLRIPAEPRATESTGLQIVQAVYGTDARNADVTAVLRTLVSGDKLRLTVGVNTLTVDPARGDDKTLFVIYTWEGRRYEARVDDGRVLDLPGRTGAAVPPPTLFGATTDGVCLHPEPQFRGNPFCVAPGQNATQLPAFSKYGSLQFRGRIRWVELFELPGFKGRQIRLEASEADLARFGAGQNPWVIRPGSLKLN